jgi:hypothetical protein
MMLREGKGEGVREREREKMEKSLHHCDMMVLKGSSKCDGCIEAVCIDVVYNLLFFQICGVSDFSLESFP